MTTIAITEENIELQLQALLVAGLPYLGNRVQPYAGELDALEEGIPIPAPCVRFYLGGHERETITTDTLSGPLSIGVLVIVASYAEGKARAGEYGAHRICRDVVALCQGSDLGIADLPPLDYLRKLLKKATPTNVAYLVEFTTALEMAR